MRAAGGRFGSDGSGSDGGFTLLEILVALVVFGILMAGLSQGIQFGLAAWRHQEQAVAAGGDLDAVDRTMRNLVERMDPGTDIAPSLAKGTAGGFEFTSVLPAAALLPAGYADVVLTVDAKHRLVMRWTPHLHAQRVGPAPAPQEAELLRGVDRLVVSYWPKPPGSGWQAAWGAQELPALVRFRLVFPPGDARHAPDVVVAPMRERAKQ